MTVTGDGALTLDDGLARFDCTIHDEVDGRRPRHRHPPAARRRRTPTSPQPLVFHRSGFGSINPTSDRPHPHDQSPKGSAPMSLTTALSEPTTPPTPRRVALASAVGATIEWYDFFLYGTAAGLVFDKLFFNGLDGPAAQFAAFGTFAVGFLARPIGGFIFGHFGDRIGRKKMLLLDAGDHGRRHRARSACCRRTTQIGVWAPDPAGDAAGAAGHRRRRRVRRRRAARRGVRPRRAPRLLRQLRAHRRARRPAARQRRVLAGQPAARRGVPRLGLARLLPGQRRAARRSAPTSGSRSWRPRRSRGAGAQGGLAAAAARPARRAAQAAAARHGHPLHRGLHVQLLLGLPARLRRRPTSSCRGRWRSAA